MAEMDDLNAWKCSDNLSNNKSTLVQDKIVMFGTSTKYFSPTESHWKALRSSAVDTILKHVNKHECDGLFHELNHYLSDIGTPNLFV